jgi:hypothetical protein
MSPAAAERIYRLLLRAYPPDFRAEYGREMVLLFRDQCRESDVRSLGFWAAVICDVARSAPALRAEAWRSRGSESTQTTEVIMKLAAMLTVLLGVLGILNAIVEWAAGSKGAIDGRYVLAVVLGVFASVLLLGAGVAILLRSRQAARLALLASVVLFVAARLLFPWMSYFSQLVGFGLPVALLVALYWPRKPSMTAGLGTVLVLLFGLSARAAAAQAKPGDTTHAAVAMKDLSLTAVQRQSFVGSYAVTLPFEKRDSLRIFEENGVLKAHSSRDQQTLRLLYQGDAVFRPEGMPNFVITFVLEGGRATKFTGRRPEVVMEGVRIR